MVKCLIFLDIFLENQEGVNKKCISDVFTPKTLDLKTQNSLSL